MSEEAAAESPSLDQVIADAPPVEAVPEPTPEPAPIDAAAVAGDKTPEQPALPDSSLVASRFNQETEAQQAIEARRADEARQRELEADLAMLRQLRTGSPEFQRQAEQVQDKIDDAEDPQSRLMQEMQAKLDRLEQQQSQYLQDEMNRREQQKLYEAKHEVSEWVKGQKESFPLINKLGEQGLVFDKMWNSRQTTGRMISESEAASEVNSEIERIVHECAPLLGYTKGNVRSERDESVSIGTGQLNVSGEPIDRDHISEDDRLNHIISEFEANQR